MTEWWQTEDMVGHLCGVLRHIKHARTSSIPDRIGICRDLFDALDNTWTAFNDFQKKPSRDNKASFKKLLVDVRGIPMDRREGFLDSEQLQSLVEFQRHVINHRTLRENNHRPGQEIEDDLMEKVTKEHRNLVDVYKTYTEAPSCVTQELLLEGASVLLLTVRNNIAHGEKNPYGLRDAEVCGVVKPILDLLIELIFDKPSHKFVVYGTLAPGSPNESKLAGMEGSWQECKVRGQKVDHEGLPYFTWDPDADEIGVNMLQSEALPDEWSYLDKWEGNSYNRILIPAKVGDHYIVGNTYEAAYRESQDRHYRE